MAQTDTCLTDREMSYTMRLGDKRSSKHRCCSVAVRSLSIIEDDNTEKIFPCIARRHARRVYQASQGVQGVLVI